jgi:two-component system cell cycle response regulator
VIEDNPTNLQLVVYLLEAFGHEVMQGREGAEGIELARREKPELILLDIHMPKMDGYEVARRLRADPECRQISIIAVTALAMVGDREKLLDSGFNGYISKPIDPQTFPTTVQSFLSAAAPPASGPARAAELVALTDSFTAPVAASVTAPVTATASAAESLPRPKLAALLFVDNTAVNIDLARSLLEPHGYEILAAPSAREGLELARRRKPDLIVSDVHMPHHDGYDFHDMVQADPELAKIPFVFLSSSVWSIREKQKALSRGALKFISRPIEGEVLLAELEACLLLGSRRPDVQPATGPDSRRLPSSNSQPAVLLFVDSSGSNLQLAESVLVSRGYGILSARSVEEGLELARHHAPDMIVSDIHLPEQDGFAFIDLVRADPVLRAIPFVFLSSTLCSERDRERALEQGAVKLLLRPIEPETLLEELEACMPSRKAL